MRHTFCFAVLGLLVACRCHAAPTWESQDIAVDYPKDGDQVKVEFKFKNSGKAPLKFLSLKTSCGCTKVSADKDEYLPGEDGKVSATVAAKGGLDEVVREIEVETNQYSEPKVLLKIRINARPLAVCQPAKLNWEKDETLVPRSIVFCSTLAGISVSGVASSSDKFSVSMERIPGTDKYRIWVEPREDPDTKTLTAELHIKTTLFTDGKAREVIVPLKVAR